MAKKSRSYKKKCQTRKSTLKNRKGKGGIFSCMGSYRRPKSAPPGIYRKNSQKSTSSSDGYGQYVIIDNDTYIIKKQTPFSSHYPGHKNKKTKKNGKTI